VLAFLLLVLVLASASAGWAGHEIPYYPSFYPQEIAFGVAEPAAAARLFAKNAIHAYVGPVSAAKGAELAWVESLRGFVVLTFNPSSRAFADPRERCGAAARVASVLTTGKSEYVAYPYPVTPWHEDYAHHADLVEAAKARAAAGPVPRIRVLKGFGSLTAGPAWRAADGEWDATIEDVSLAALLRDESTSLNGWTSPPWLKEGWFHAHALSARAVTDPAARSAIEETFLRRTRGDYASAVDRLNLERRLVLLVTRGCERVPVGYALRREAVNDSYSEGVENIGYDSQGGLASGVFLRTVKLKDFPWNGWLRVATPARPTAAWNPIAGFSDETGALIWSVLGDAAVLPEPYGVGWLPNRVRAVEISGQVDVPRDALVPEPSTGALRPATPGTVAERRVTYRVSLSKFHDETKMSVADLVYPYVFVGRWSTRDRRVDRATALLRDRLVAVRVLKVETEVRDFGDLQVLLDTPLIEVYLRGASEPESPAIAPPWSPVPWQLMVLMEEAVTRGLAAFSEDEARRRGIPWLDLARDRKLVDALGAIAESFERRSYVPDALKGLVSVEQARQRWAALRRFRQKSGHWLVTSGPYRLQKWSADSTTLAVFRDLSYPNVVGSFDGLALPRRAWVAAADRRGDRIELQVDAQTITKFERSYKIVREPMSLIRTGEKAHDTVVARWTVIGAGDEVVATGRAQDVENGRLVVDLKGKLAPGAYRVLLAPALNGNSTNAEAKVISYRVIE
jgi:hypothetical protein